MPSFQISVNQKMKCDIHLPFDYLHVLAVGKIHQITTILSTDKHETTRDTSNQLPTAFSPNDVSAQFWITYHHFKLNTHPLFGITFVGAIHYHIKDHFKKSTTLHFQTPQNHSTSPPQKKNMLQRRHIHISRWDFPRSSV